MVENKDELAVVALLKALRSRDIELPDKESLGLFYVPPPSSTFWGDLERENRGAENMELADTLSELAMCYRRLGRYTAAIRAFYAATDAAGEKVASSVLCSCAQGKINGNRLSNQSKL